MTILHSCLSWLSVGLTLALLLFLDGDPKGLPRLAAFRLNLVISLAMRFAWSAGWLRTWNYLVPIGAAWRVLVIVEAVWVLTLATPWRERPNRWLFVVATAGAALDGWIALMLMGGISAPPDMPKWIWEMRLFTSVWCATAAFAAGLLFWRYPGRSGTAHAWLLSVYYASMAVGSAQAVRVAWQVDPVFDSYVLAVQCACLVGWLRVL